MQQLESHTDCPVGLPSSFSEESEDGALHLQKTM